MAASATTTRCMTGPAPHEGGVSGWARIVDGERPGSSADASDHAGFLVVSVVAVQHPDAKIVGDEETPPSDRLWATALMSGAASIPVVGLVHRS